MPNSAAGPPQALIQHPSFAVFSAADLCVREVRERLLAGKPPAVPAAAPPRSVAALPDELARCIVSFLAGKDVLALEATSSGMRALCAEANPWPELCRREWGLEVQEAYERKRGRDDPAGRRRRRRRRKQSPPSPRQAYRLALEGWMQMRREALGGLPSGSAFASGPRVVPLSVMMCY